jgi:hypothetical protein
MKFNYFDSGVYNTICDVCGFKYKSNELKQRWDGLMVCPEDWEQRHPQELIRPIQDQNRLPWTRPEGTNQFIASCTPTGRQGVAGLGVTGCAIAGLDLGFRGLEDITHNA